MQKLTSSQLLDQLILIKQEERDNQGRVLKQEFRVAYENLKPINILKNTFKQATSSPDLKTQIVDTAIGLTTGFIAKKLFTGNSNNPFVKLVGSLLGSFVSSKAEKNADEIKAIGSFLVNKATNKDHLDHGNEL